MLKDLPEKLLSHPRLRMKNLIVTVSGYKIGNHSGRLKNPTKVSDWSPD